MKELINQFQHLFGSFQREKESMISQLTFANRMRHFESQYSLATGETVRLEVGRRSHISDILVIERAGYNGKTPWGYVALERDIVLSSKSLYFMLYEAETPVAFLGSRHELTDLHITNIAVIPSMQQKGLGVLLLQLLCFVAKEEHISTISLEVRVSNKKAIALYQKVGFQVKGLKKNYYHGDGEDALDMVLKVEDVAYLKEQSS